MDLLRPRDSSSAMLLPEDLGDPGDLYEDTLPGLDCVDLAGDLERSREWSDLVTEGGVRVAMDSFEPGVCEMDRSSLYEDIDRVGVAAESISVCIVFDVRPVVFSAVLIRPAVPDSINILLLFSSVAVLAVVPWTCKRKRRHDASSSFPGKQR